MNRNYLVAGIITLFGLSVALLSGCVDQCADQYCLNGGECVDGDCDCATGFTGIHCNDPVGGSSSGGSSSGGSSSGSSSSGSSSSGGSSSGGNYNDDIDGSWLYYGGGVENTILLNICDNGLYQFYVENSDGTNVLTDNEGTWSVQGSTLTLDGTGTFDILSLNVSGGTGNLSIRFSSGLLDPYNLSLTPDNPCSGLGGGSSSGGSSSSSSGSSSSGSSSSGGGSCVSTVTDVDGNSYQVAQIGNQCWMRSNLETTHYRDGSVIPLEYYGNNSGQLQWIMSSEGGYVEVNTGSYPNYGNLYNRAAANDSRGICPDGWRVPSENDYEQLINYLGGPVSASSALKTTSGWCSVNTFAPGSPTVCGNGNNQSMFSAYPTGIITPGFSQFIEHDGSWWTSTDDGDGNKVMHLSGYYYEPFSLETDAEIQNNGPFVAACRCIKE